MKHHQLARPLKNSEDIHHHLKFCLGVCLSHKLPLDLVSGAAHSSQCACLIIQDPALSLSLVILQWHLMEGVSSVHTAGTFGCVTRMMLFIAFQINDASACLISALTDLVIFVTCRAQSFLRSCVKICCVFR